MCLAIPTRIVKIDGDMAIGEVGGVQREVSLMMTPGVKVGDYVIVHAGFAIQVLEPSHARENLEVLAEMRKRVEGMRKKVKNRG
ncbi:MAG: HypC/HybG/HupF family hydrogenase formation chaperone [bacterium]